MAFRGRRPSPLPCSSESRRPPWLSIIPTLFTLAALVALGPGSSAQNQLMPVVTVQKVQAPSQWIGQTSVNRCINGGTRMPFPNNDILSQEYHVAYRSGVKYWMQVPTALLANYYDSRSSANKEEASFLGVRASILAEYCSELPYLLYGLWPEGSKLRKDGQDIFEAASLGCTLLAHVFGPAGHAHLGPDTTPADSLSVIARAVAQVLDKNSRVSSTRLVETESVLKEVRARIHDKVTALQRENPQHWAVLVAAKPFYLFAKANDAQFAQKTMLELATTLRDFFLDVDAETQALRLRRASGKLPWPVQDHQWTVTIQLNHPAKQTLLAALNRSPLHISMDVEMHGSQITSLMPLIPLQVPNSVQRGLSSGCALEDVSLKTFMFESNRTTTNLSLLSTKLTAPKQPLQIKPGEAEKYVVSWHAPQVATPGLTLDRLRQVLASSPQLPVRLQFVIAATVRTGTSTCATFPIVPVTLRPAYACADEFGAAPKTSTRIPQYEKLTSTAPESLASDFVNHSQAEDAWEDDLDAEFSEQDGMFEDDLDGGEYSLGDEHALEDESAYSLAGLEDESAWDEDALDEDAADFAFEDNLADEDGLDVADYALADVFAEDSIYGDE